MTSPAGRVASSCPSIDRVVLRAVGERVELEHRCLGLDAHGGEPRPQKQLVPGRRAAEHAHVGLGEATPVLVPCRGEGGSQAHEVPVGVEDHHREVGVDQQLLEELPHRVGLARAALAAPEGVADSNRRGGELRRAAPASSGSCAGTLEQRPSRRVQHHLDGGGVDLLDRARLRTDRPRRVSSRALGEHADQSTTRGARAASRSVPRRAPAAARLCPTRRRSATRRRGSCRWRRRPRTSGRRRSGRWRVAAGHPCADHPRPRRRGPTPGSGNQRLAETLGSGESAAPAVTLAFASRARRMPRRSPSSPPAHTFPLACPPSTTAEAIAAFIAAQPHRGARCDRTPWPIPCRTLLVAEEPDARAVGWHACSIAGEPGDADAAAAVVAGLAHRRAEQVLHEGPRPRVAGRRGVRS